MNVVCTQCYTVREIIHVLEYICTQTIQLSGCREELCEATGEVERMKQELESRDQTIETQQEAESELRSTIRHQVSYIVIRLNNIRHHQVETDRASTYVRRSTYDISCICAVMLFTSSFPSDGRQICCNSQSSELLILKLILVTINNYS